MHDDEVKLVLDWLAAAGALRLRGKRLQTRTIDAGIQGHKRLSRRVWYGGRKGRRARLRMHALGTIVYRWDGCPEWHPRCSECGAPKIRHSFRHWQWCSKGSGW